MANPDNFSNYFRNGQARIWDTATWSQIAQLSGHTGAVTAIAIAPSGAWLATAGNSDSAAQIWDTATWSQIAQLSGHTGGVTAIAIAPSGAWLAIVSLDCTVRVWDTTTWRLLTMTRLDSYATCVAWQGQTTLALGGRAGLHLFDVLTSTAYETLEHTIC